MATSHWVFGYGSLIWKQDFPFLASRRARLDKWVRRFWQGSHDHRGVADDPGRVVTLIQSTTEVCHGRAFLVDSDTLSYLDHREKNGYERHELPMYFVDGQATGITYIAPTDNFAFLGDAPLEEMVEQILRCEGESGTNVEYVLELAQALRRLDVDDPHVFEIERWLKE